ncbi:hypothetical protein [Ewingella americana]|uniref:hypothetical protein n=1 Tax=Ewingella americana TaxID=41202 RepID=UPI0013872BA6|nr:hypothetical protein [Ewingella americana]
MFIQSILAYFPFSGIDHIRFWHTTAKQEQGTYERNADLQLLSAFPLIDYIT